LPPQVGARFFHTCSSFPGPEALLFICEPVGIRRLRKLNPSRRDLRPKLHAPVLQICRIELKQRLPDLNRVSSFYENVDDHPTCQRPDRLHVDGMQLPRSLDDLVDVDEGRNDQTDEYAGHEGPQGDRDDPA
jgi:hypothetical protein